METTYFDLLTLMIYSIGLSSESVACGVEVVLALLRAKEIADFTDGAPEGVDGPDGAGSQKGLQFCESHLDRIEVGAIGRRNMSRPWREQPARRRRFCGPANCPGLRRRPA